MNFNEYKNAAYWQSLRNERKDVIEDSASAKDVAAIILGFVGLFVALCIV